MTSQLPDKIYSMSNIELISEIERLRKDNHSLRTMISALRQKTTQRTMKRSKILELWHGGSGVKRIAADVGCSLQHVYYTINREKMIQKEKCPISK